jgi:hypothetical protein
MTTSLKVSSLKFNQNVNNRSDCNNLYSVCCAQNGEYDNFGHVYVIIDKTPFGQKVIYPRIRIINGQVILGQDSTLEPYMTNNNFKFWWTSEEMIKKHNELKKEYQESFQSVNVDYQYTIHDQYYYINSRIFYANIPLNENLINNHLDIPKDLMQHF